jgi:pimeloyl-ACP methyl ester carboxylesterase
MELNVTTSARGDGLPVLLVHGYSSAGPDWKLTGWTQALERAGRAWVAPDLPGHGRSDMPREPDAYRVDAVVESLRLTLDALELERVDLVGYSLGGELALELALAHPERIRRLVVGGIGNKRPVTAEDASALYEHVARRESPPPGRARELWSYASGLPGADPVALAACLAGISGSRPMDGFERFPGPTLLFAGTDDPVADGIEALQARLANSELFRLEGFDHMTALRVPAARERAVEFLGDGST